MNKEGQITDVVIQKLLQNDCINIVYKKILNQSCQPHFTMNPSKAESDWASSNIHRTV